MNVYSKLAKARVELQSIEMSKSGHNKFAGYKYFELGDFLPHINSIFDKLGLCDVITFSNETAYLTIYDTSEMDKVFGVTVFSTPMAEAPLKGALPIQALGAQHTYMRRYLYMLALNITEHDAIDASEPVKPSKDEVIAKLTKAAEKGSESLKKAYLKLNKEEQDLAKEAGPSLREIASNADVPN